jgi:lysophospholipase L1-like esterase
MRRALIGRLSRLFIVLAVIAAAARAENSAPPHDFARWESAIAAFEAQDREQPPRDDEVMFIGSSTMRLWKTSDSFPDLAVVNRGFGGSEMIDSVHFAPRILGAHRPRVLLVYAGSNDLSKGTKPSAVAEHFEQFVAAVQASSPDTQIVYLSIKPSVKRWPIVHRVRAANALIESVCIDLPNVHFLNVHSAMLNSAGQPETAYLAADGLHLNDLGYQHLTALVRPTIDRLLSGETDSSPARGPAPAAAH